MNSILYSQYSMVLDSRKALLGYCATISQEDFVRSSQDFGKGGSIRNMMVHICNTYQGWLSSYVEGSTAMELEHTNLPTLIECRNYFELTDDLVLSFISEYENNCLDVLKANFHGDVFETTPLQLFTHVITHEFHHKGQILSLSRLWGYTPVDTDILR